tara:strand:- start:1044 stop:1277 length:234 start_codon:yes stop_codon:yes gene_type:complete
MTLSIQRHGVNAGVISISRLWRALVQVQCLSITKVVRRDNFQKILTNPNTLQRDAAFCEGRRMSGNIKEAQAVRDGS